MTSALIRAVALYSLREAQEGHATVIQIRTEGPHFRVSDNGRGHAVERTVDGEPYLKFVYEHLLAFPFGRTPAPTVQLHVVGMSLVAVMCRDLIVEARKTDASVRLYFRDGVHQRTERASVSPEGTGNTIEGTLAHHLAGRGADIATLRTWLKEIASSFPTLTLLLNGGPV